MKKTHSRLTISQTLQAELQLLLKNQLSSHATESKAHFDARLTNLDRQLSTLTDAKQNKLFNLNAFVGSMITDTLKYILAIAGYQALIYTAHHPNYTRMGFAGLIAVVFSVCGVRIYRSFINERKEVETRGQLAINALQAMHSLNLLVGALVAIVCSLITSPNQIGVFSLVGAAAGVSALYNYRRATLAFNKELGRKGTLRELVNRVFATSSIIPFAE